MELLRSIPDLISKPATANLLAVIGIAIGAVVIFSSPVAGAIVLVAALLVLLLLVIASYWIGREQRWIVEILSSETVLDLQDDRGHLATLTKRYNLKFLQHRVLVLNETFSGSGNQLAEYRCSLGPMVDRFRFGDDEHIVISLRNFFDRGSEVAVETVRKIEDGFTSPQENFSLYTGRHVGPMSVRVVLPGSRPVQNAFYVKASERRSRPLSVVADSGGRQVICLELTRPGLSQNYTINWAW